MAGRFTIEAVFKAVNRVTAPVSKMQNSVGKFTRSMSRNFHKLNRVVGKFTSGIKKGALIAGAALAGIGVAMRNIIMVGAEFGRAIGAAAAKFPDKIKRGTKEFKALEEAARRVGATTEFTATQAAQGLNFLAKAGFNAKFSVKALSSIVDFATASEMDFAEAADIASDALGAFGLDSNDTTKKMEGLNRIMDVMSLTANSTNVSVSELFETVKKGAPVAIKAGQSIETFAAVAGVLAGVGIKASEAGTATKNIALALAGVGNQAGKTFKKLGIALETPNGKMRDIADVFEDLSKVTKGMDEAKVLGVMNAIFGKISLASAANLLGEGAGKIRKLRTELENAGGSAKRTAAFIRNDVKGSIDGLTSAIDGVKISIFSLNEGPLKEAIDRMTEWVRTNEKMIASGIGNFMLMIINNMDKIVEWIVKIGKGLAIFFAFSAVLKILIGVMTLVNLVMAANPIVLIVLGVIALIAAFTALVIWIDDVVGAFENMNPILRVILAPLELILRTIKGIKDLGGFLGGKLGKFVADIGVDSSFEDVSKNIVTPQERVASSIEEHKTTSTSEVTIKTEQGTTATVTSGKMGNGLQLQSSGAM